MSTFKTVNFFFENAHEQIFVNLSHKNKLKRYHNIMTILLQKKKKKLMYEIKGCIK